MLEPTVFVHVVVVICDITCVVRNNIIRNSMRQDIPYAGASSLCFYGAFNLICSTRNAIPKILWELPAFVLWLKGYLLAGRERGIVEWWRWNE